jgi:hypothetical protein
VAHSVITVISKQLLPAFDDRGEAAVVVYFLLARDE